MTAKASDSDPFDPDQLRDALARLQRTESAGPHPPAEVLEAYAGGVLTEEEDDEIVAHITFCPSCEGAVAQLQARVEPDWMDEFTASPSGSAETPRSATPVTVASSAADHQHTMTQLAEFQEIARRELGELRMVVAEISRQQRELADGLRVTTEQFATGAGKNGGAATVSLLQPSGAWAAAACLLVLIGGQWWLWRSTHDAVEATRQEIAGIPLAGTAGVDATMRASLDELARVLKARSPEIGTSVTRVDVFPRGTTPMSAGPSPIAVSPDQTFSLAFPVHARDGASRYRVQIVDDSGGAVWPARPDETYPALEIPGAAGASARCVILTMPPAVLLPGRRYRVLLDAVGSDAGYSAAFVTAGGPAAKDGPSPSK